MFKKYLSNLRIAQKFMLVITPVLIVLLISGCLLFDQYITRKLTDSYEKSVSILAGSFHESVKGSLERGQMKNFQKLLSNQLNIEGVLDVSLYNKEGHLDMSSAGLTDNELKIDQTSFIQAKDTKERFARTNGAEYQLITPQITTPDCVRCHQGWPVGELGGILSLTYDLTPLQDAIKNQRLFLTYGCAALVLIITCLLYFVTRSVTKPIVQMTGVMQQLSENDLSVTIPGENRKDEIGAMGSAVSIFKENAQKRDELEKKLTKMADSFESNVGSILTSVLNELGTIQEAVNQVSASAESTNSLSISVVSSSTATAENVQSVATAIKQMHETNSEINDQVEFAANISTKAVLQTTATNDLVQNFAKRANEIEQVVGLISEIAEQTNLLSLNATIEAARAGDAGKGFAVVATEVKELAAQTKRATKNIADKIGAIQTASTESVESIQTVSTVLSEINDIAVKIATSVGQQQQTSTEISENMHRAALDSEGVSNNLTNVVTATEQTGHSARDVQDKINNLITQTDILKKNLNAFLKHVRQIS